MKRFGAAMFGTLQLLSTIALVQAAAPVSKWPAAQLAIQFGRGHHSSSHGGLGRQLHQGVGLKYSL